MFIKSPQSGMVWNLAYHKEPKRPGWVSATEYKVLKENSGADLLQPTGVQWCSEIEGRATKAARQAAVSRLLKRIQEIQPAE